MADTNTCDVTARAEILDIKQRLTDAEEAIVGKAEVTHSHSAADYIGATEDQLNALEALAAAFRETGDVLDAYALADHTHSEYATKTEVTEQINGIDIPEVDLTGYYTRTETDEYFATIGYVDDVIADIDVDVDLTGYATKDYVTNEINELVLSGDGPQVDLSIYALKSDIQETDLSDYALKTDVPTVPTKVSAFTNDAGYLTKHQDLSNYALKSELPNVSAYQTAAQVQALIDSSLASFGNAEDGEY